MDSNTLAAAFTPGGMTQQLAFLLLVAAMLSTDLGRLRALVAAAALVGLAHALAFSGNPIAAIWWGVLLSAALLMLGRRAAENNRVRFTGEEEEMLKGPLATLHRSRARHFIDQGFWLTGREGDVLINEGEPVSHLYFLAAGEARVLSHGRQVGACWAGDLIGEATILTGEGAGATVVLAGPARFWCAPAAVLREYVQAHDDVRRALEQGVTASLRAKLHDSNRRIAEAGGVVA